MALNYRDFTGRITNRVNPEGMLLKASLKEELSRVSYSDVLTFVRTAMMAVPLEYTERSIEAGRRVEEHLRTLQNKEFRRQGSVMTNTHIKAYSDIDVLVISTKFYSWDSLDVKMLLSNTERRNMYGESSITKLQNENNNSSYQGDDIYDLSLLRTNSESILSSFYNQCDTSHPKAIKIRNTALNRNVDVSIACWYDDVMSIINDKGEYRGVRLYNKKLNLKEKADFPFISIKRINDKSAATNGRLKRLIRFMKNVKAELDQDIDLSSFDINAICYDIDTSEYSDKSFIELVPVIYRQLYNICNDTAHANSIISVDGREYIFRGNNSKLESVRATLSAVSQIYDDINRTL